MDEEQLDDLTTKSLFAFLLCVGSTLARVDRDAPSDLTTADLLHALDTTIANHRPRFLGDLSEAVWIQVLRLRRELRCVIDLYRNEVGLPPLPPDA